MRKGVVAMKTIVSDIHWGDIVMCDFGAAYGCEQGGLRPALVVQNDVGNKHSPTIIVCPITSSKSKKPLPTHIKITPAETGIKVESTILFEAIRCVDKKRIKNEQGEIVKVGQVNESIRKNIQKVLTINFQMCYNNT